jgi:hypothetical protein
VVLEIFLGIDSILVFSVHEFELQDLQGKNDIKPEGSLEEVQDPDGSSGTQLEQDGQSGYIWNQLFQYSSTWQPKSHHKICENSSNVLELVQVDTLISWNS